MGAKTKLDIETDQLHSAAGKAGQTLAASVIGAIPPPLPRRCRSSTQHWPQ